MKILITGGAGFIGSHIQDAYIREDYEVAVVDNLITGKKKVFIREQNFIK